MLVNELLESLVVLLWGQARYIGHEQVQKVVLNGFSGRVFRQNVNDSKEKGLLVVYAIKSY